MIEFSWWAVVSGAGLFILGIIIGSVFTSAAITEKEKAEWPPPCYATLISYQDVAEKDCFTCKYYRNCLSEMHKRYPNNEGEENA